MALHEGALTRQAVGRVGLARWRLMQVANSGDHSIVLTGCGWVTPAAAGSIGEVLTTARQGGSRPPAGEGYWAVREDQLAGYPDLSKEIKSDKCAWMTAVAFECARREALLAQDSVAAERVGLALGCALAGQLGMIQFANEVRQQSARFVSPIHFPQTVGNYVAGALARSYGIRGPNTTLSCGVASGLDAIIEGCRLLHAGNADVVFAGGTDCMSAALALGLSEVGLGGPSERDDPSGQGDSLPALSEGACLFVLERADHAGRRGAGALATVTGSGHYPAEGSQVTRAVTSPKAAAGDTDLSVAGLQHPDAVCVEHWVGRCFAALGSAAVAAAIGAARGLEVPRCTADATGSGSAGRASVSSITRADRHSAATKVMVVADADGAHLSKLDLAVPTPAGR